MKQKTLTAGGIKLNYIEQNPDATDTIFFFHGNSGSFNTWLQQLESPLLSRYRLIAFDFPGHGQSDAPKNLAMGYSLPGLGDLMAAPVKKLAESLSYMLVGFSLGTNILCEAMIYGLLPKGIVLISPCVLRTADDLTIIFRPNPHVAYFFKEHVTHEQLELLTNECFYQQHAARDIFKKDFWNTKSEFRSTLHKTSSEGAYTNEVNTLTEYNIPVLAIFGKEDKIVDPAYLGTMQLPIWHTSIFRLEDAGHFAHIDAANATTELLANYAKEIF